MLSTRRPSNPLTPAELPVSSGRRGSGKKSALQRGQGFGGAVDSLETFLKRLRDLCPDHGQCDGDARTGQIQDQARQANHLARELGILTSSADVWEKLEGFRGSEHLVELDAPNRRAIKITIPPAFGLVPRLKELPVVDLRSEQAATRTVIEFFPATPLEYLERWQAANDVFGDDVRLASVIEWPDGAVSLCITQPQYHGEPAEPREIESFFLKNGWTRLKDPSGHVVFFHHAFGVLAIDAERRNCYLTGDRLQPFDVILCRPDAAMGDFLKIRPQT